MSFPAVEVLGIVLSVTRPMHVAQLPISWMKSGTEQQVLDLSAKLVERGTRVTIIVPGGRRLDRLVLDARAIGAQVERIGPFFFGRSRDRERSLFQLGRALLRIRPDVFHVHYPYLYWHPRVIGVARLAGVRRIARTEHNPIQSQASLRQRVMVRAVDSMLDRIVFVSSDNMRKHRLLCGRPAAKCSVIPNAIDASTISSDASEAYRTRVRTELNLPLDRPIALKIGAYDERQGPGDFVRAAAEAAKTSNLHFALLGDCPSRVTLEALAKQLNVFDRLHFLGRRDDVRQILCVFDIYVQCSHYEGMSVSMLEALAAGLPMVTTRVDGVSDVLPGEQGALFANIYDVRTLGEAISRLSNDAELRRDLSGISQSRVRTAFTTEALCASWSALYENMLAE